MIKDKINIIIAEDSKQFIEGLKIALKQCHRCEIIDTCSNGLELCESPELNRADLIISDIEMPVMNGFEAAKRVNFEYPKLPMIALTMHIESVFIEDIIMAGFKGFVYKPEITEKLNEVINNVLNNSYSIPDNLKTK